MRVSKTKHTIQRIKSVWNRSVWLKTSGALLRFWSLMLKAITVLIFLDNFFIIVDGSRFTTFLALFFAFRRIASPCLTVVSCLCKSLPWTTKSVVTTIHSITTRASCIARKGPDVKTPKKLRPTFVVSSNTMNANIKMSWGRMILPISYGFTSALPDFFRLVFRLEKKMSTRAVLKSMRGIKSEPKKLMTSNGKNPLQKIGSIAIKQIIMFCTASVMRTLTGIPLKAFSPTSRTHRLIRHC